MPVNIILLSEKHYLSRRNHAKRNVAARTTRVVAEVPRADIHTTVVVATANKPWIVRVDKGGITI
jgi:phenylpyruvate tautomerase PptA (4-oxalocrotonate tautomerase family)